VQDAWLAVHWQMTRMVHIQEDPEGRVPWYVRKRIESSMQRRSAAAQRLLGGRYPVCTRGMAERRVLKRACAGETQSEQLHAEKAEEVQKWSPYKDHLVHNLNVC
jgi:hypothetical protein